MLVLLFLTAMVAQLLRGAQAISPPHQHFWRNDSANLAVTASWNRYYAATPFSWDVTSPNITDTPPFALDWSVGTDSPLGQKDGHGCLFADRYFVIAGGVATHTWTGPNGGSTTSDERVGADDDSKLPATSVTMYDMATDRWSMLPPMPYTPLRTTGCCGSDALFIISGEGSNAVFSGGEASRQGAMLTMKVRDRSDRTNHVTSVAWEWTLLPELPAGGGRWLAAAGVIDDWLVLTGGTNTPGIEAVARSPDLRDTAAAGHECAAVNGADRPGGGIYPRCFFNVSSRKDNTTCNCPPWLPSYKLFVGQRLGTSWEPIAKFPSDGYDVPNYAATNGSLYIFGGWRANPAGEEAWQMGDGSLYGLSSRLDLPVPITIGTNGAQLLRAAWRYTLETDSWTRLPDLPYHMCSGGTVVLANGRYIVQVKHAPFLAPTDTTTCC
jgi:hypothetical protein